MAGIYIHIPFCKSRCVYCDFFSTTQLTRRKEYVDALIHEWQQRVSEIHPKSETGVKNTDTKPQNDETIRTIYLGGGTPSLLEINDLERLLNALPITEAEEITMECNPGDITPAKAQAWRKMGINRLSIGIQSFDDTLLKKIGRRHTADEARSAVRTAQEVGFENISIDIIYGLPWGTDNGKRDIEEAISLHVQHISTYCLTIEEGTPLARMLQQGEIQETDEDTENTTYDYIAGRLREAGFEHYEVSNFALAGRRSLHNSNYWNNTPYIGLGAGAHSYNGIDRSWNPADLETYIRGINEGRHIRETEHLSDTDRYNEQIMLGLRTSDGVLFSDLRTPDIAEQYIAGGLLRLTDSRPQRVVATQEGLHILNQIIEDLFL